MPSGANLTLGTAVSPAPVDTLERADRDRTAQMTHSAFVIETYGHQRTCSSIGLIVNSCASADVTHGIWHSSTEDEAGSGVGAQQFRGHLCFGHLVERFARAVQRYDVIEVDPLERGQGFSHIILFVGR